MHTKTGYILSEQNKICLTVRMGALVGRGMGGAGYAGKGGP